MLPPLTISARQSIRPTAIALLAVGLATFCAYWLRLNLASTVLLQLLVVVIAALRIGFWQATLVSFVANACLLYFIVPPVFSFAISDPQNWVGLAVFEFTALLVSRLSTSAQLEAANAASRQREIERLYEFSCKLLLLDRRTALGRQVVLLIERTFEVQTVALYDCSSERLEHAGASDRKLEELAIHAHRSLNRLTNAEPPTFIDTLRVADQPIATLAIRGLSMTQMTFHAVASLTSATFDRWRSFENETKAKGERHTERLRAAVLDALARQFKEPLRTIQSASTAMLATQSLGAAEETLVSLIDSEIWKLDRLTSRLLQTSHLDSTEVRLHRELTPAAAIVRETLSILADQLRAHPVRTHGLDCAAEVLLDRDLMVTALSQIVDNAAKYSNPGSTISVSLEGGVEGMRISVHTVGPAIPKEHLNRLFERFYRSPRAQNQPPGSGLGLSVTKKIIEAHGGKVGVRSGNDGNTFYLELPQERSGSETSATSNGQPQESVA
jgi:two-component system sensor histidine kinase KdpD